jgi:hypothetical protein
MKKNGKKISECNGKKDDFQLTSLDMVWGFNEISRYGTINEEEYIVRLRDMTRSDLENHARGVGCMVLESSERLREALLKQFRAYVLSLKKPTSSKPTMTKISADTQRILNEGR